MKDVTIAMAIVMVAGASFYGGVCIGHADGYRKGKHDGVEAVYLKLRDKTIQQSEETRCLVPKA